MHVKMHKTLCTPFYDIIYLYTFDTVIYGSSLITLQEQNKSILPSAGSHWAIKQARRQTIQGHGTTKGKEYSELGKAQSSK